MGGPTRNSLAELVAQQLCVEQAKKKDARRAFRIM